ncbi:serine hydrolase [Amycolatopsis sp. 195334CR]|uniref:serine hydrolase domain-containing protein n=1 Tax=Amycolatopsis sp. 195334CR TaxID=2814588 RepID=UPI001A8E01FA|nr:serine hydrolase domain-containing protein [Amycolatopsis sp. 195334CR]MBN6034389.1 beta-lactamase family protein [Amycolatopsis sp. 195334CR]
MRGKRATTATVIAALTTATVAPALAVTPGYDGAALQRDLDAIRAAGIVGVQAHADTGARRLTARSGTAEAGTSIPVPRGGSFRMGSSTKTFVAVVVLQLVGEGKLALEDKVAGLLPGVVTSPAGDQITVRHLLQQTSGLHDFVADLPARDQAAFLERRFDHVPAAQFVADAMSKPPEFAPGTGWAYSNTNYLLAGMLVERLTGNSWADEVRSRILDPLELNDTYAPGEATGLAAPHAKGYTRWPGTPEPVETTELSPTWGDASGGLVSTTADMTRFWQALLGGELLAPAEFAEMRKTVPATGWQKNNPGSAYGLGIASLPLSCGEVAWSHNGDVMGFQTRNGFSDDGSRGVVVSLSTQDFGTSPARDVVKRVVDEVVCE